MRDLGALWQYDATPHLFLPNSRGKQVLLDLLDDATQLQCRCPPLSHRNPPGSLRLPRAFQTHGLPLALYVDYHSFFFTQLGTAMHFYGVTLRYAPTPQAKGKIERRHDYWQKRLPPLLAADRILELEGANHLLDQLLPHVNQHEIHRQLGTTPLAAKQQALDQKHSVLHPVPAYPWWPFVWSQQTKIRVGDDGKVPVGSQRQAIEAPPRSKVIRCLRPDGDIYYLQQAPPDQKTKPIVLLHCPVF